MFAFNLKELLASAGILAAALGTYFGTQITTDAKISEVRQDVAVQAVEVNNLAEDVVELKADVDKIDDKINALLVKQGINPNKFETISTYEGQ